jgi:hypothetical protein
MDCLHNQVYFRRIPAPRPNQAPAHFSTHPVAFARQAKTMTDRNSKSRLFAINPTPLTL